MGLNGLDRHDAAPEAVRRALDLHAPADKQSAIVALALAGAGLAQLPEDAAGLDAFVCGALRAAVEEVVGEEPARALVDWWTARTATSQGELEPPVKLALVAEGDTKLRATLSSWLRAAGFEVINATDGPMALALSLRRRPDVVVASEGLRGVGGTQLVNLFRVAFDAPPPVLLLCDEERPDASGDQLVKPVAQDRLVASALKASGGAAPASGVASRVEEGSISDDRLARVMAVTTLGSGLGQGLQAAATELRDALGCHACVIAVDQPRRFALDAPRPVPDDHLAPLFERMQLAIEAARPLVGEALLTADDGEQVETYHAVRASAAERSLMLCLVDRGWRERRSQHELLPALASRLLLETSWHAVRERMVTELDAVREVGGLDPLLGVWSRSMLVRLLDMVMSARRRSGGPLSIALIDVRGMGGINDRFGHREGDAVLKHVAEIAVYLVRSHDVVARYGGDEIAIVLDGTGVEEAVKIVERLRMLLVDQPLQTDDGSELTVEILAGVTAAGGCEDTAEAALARAASAAARAAESSEIVVVSWEDEGAPSQARPPARPLEGLTLAGAYRILHEIGAGGGGGVYRGEDLSLRRPVAVKVLRSDMAHDEKLVERFREEATILAALRHPNLVQVYAFGVEASHAYFVMELVEGESLFDAIARCRKERTRFPLTRAASIVRQITSALSALHGAAIIHRDVKPANILLDPFRNRAVLVDVGIAARTGATTYLAGTPGYMAPEAARDPLVGASADVYGLAATIYELLVLQQPWPPQSDIFEMLRVQRDVPPTPISHYDPLLEPLDEVFARALAASPENRFPDVMSFGQAFVAAATSLGSTAPPASTNPASSKLTSSAAISSVETAPTLRLSAMAEPEEGGTRGVVFRSFLHVIGARQAARWRMTLGTRNQELANALSPSSPPLAWLPTAWLVELLQSGAPGREDPQALGRDLGKAAVRSSFRRFFPASAATLAPTGTLHVLPQIWSQYHSWGSVEVSVKEDDRATVRVWRTVRSRPVCAVVEGMLDQLIVLSGADSVEVVHDACACDGEPSCQFTVQWTWSRADRSWLRE